MTELIDRILNVLPGAKAYLTGLVMVMIAIMQFAGFSTPAIDTAFDPTDAGNLFLEGIGLIFVRRGIKDYAAPAAPVARAKRSVRRG